jgi:hypothetical protein
MNSSQSAGLATSARTASTSPPVADSISSAVFCNNTSRRAQMATRAPSSQKRNAVARPIPSLPPVMAATLPFNPRSIASLIPPHGWAIEGSRVATDATPHVLSSDRLLHASVIPG